MKKKLPHRLAFLAGPPCLSQRMCLAVSFTAVITRASDFCRYRRSLGGLENTQRTANISFTDATGNGGLGILPGRRLSNRCLL